MARLTIVYWRDIPSEVIVKSGRTAAKRELSERFIRAIDAAAMHAKAKAAAERLGLAFERWFTGLAGLQAFLGKAAEEKPAEEKGEPWPD